MQDETNGNNNQENFSQPNMQPPVQYPAPPPSYYYPPPQQPYYGQPVQPPVYYPARPKIPGRGLGIASMILGIFATIYSVFGFTVSMAQKFHIPLDSSPGNGVETYGETNSVIVMGSVSLVCAILALVFSVCSRNKGGRNGISNAGLVLSIVSFVFIAAAIVVMVSTML